MSYVNSYRVGPAHLAIITASGMCSYFDSIRLSYIQADQNYVFTQEMTPFQRPPARGACARQNLGAVR